MCYNDLWLVSNQLLSENKDKDVHRFALSALSRNFWRERQRETEREREKGRERAINNR